MTVWHEKWVKASADFYVHFKYLSMVLYNKRILSIIEKNQLSVEVFTTFFPISPKDCLDYVLVSFLNTFINGCVWHGRIKKVESYRLKDILHFLHW